MKPWRIWSEGWHIHPCSADLHIWQLGVVVLLEGGHGSIDLSIPCPSSLAGKPVFLSLLMLCSSAKTLVIQHTYAQDFTLISLSSVWNCFFHCRLLTPQHISSTCELCTFLVCCPVLFTSSTSNFFGGISRIWVPSMAPMIPCNPQSAKNSLCLVEVASSVVGNCINQRNTSKLVSAYTSFYNVTHCCCDGPKSSLLHCCIFPVARYWRVAITFISGLIALFLAVGLEMVSRAKSVTNRIPSRSRRYPLMSSASLISFSTSLLSRKVLERRWTAALAMFVYCFGDRARR